MAEKPLLPKKLFMAWNTAGNEPFLDHSEDPACIAEKGETIEAGLYELQSIVRLVNKTEVKRYKHGKT